MSTAVEGMTLAEKIAYYRKHGLPKAPQPISPKPSAEVVPLPQGTALAIIKEGRTSAEEISKALERETERRKERQRLADERAAAAAAEAHARRLEAFMNSQDMAMAADRFNRSQGYYRQGDW